MTDTCYSCLHRSHACAGNPSWQPEALCACLPFGLFIYRTSASGTNSLRDSLAERKVTSHFTYMTRPIMCARLLHFSDTSDDSQKLKTSAINGNLRARKLQQLTHGFVKASGLLIACALFEAGLPPPHTCHPLTLQARPRPTHVTPIDLASMPLPFTLSSHSASTRHTCFISMASRPLHQQLRNACMGESSPSCEYPEVTRHLDKRKWNELLARLVGRKKSDQPLHLHDTTYNVCAKSSFHVNCVEPGIVKLCSGPSKGVR
jgi:hypothetical protein